MTVLGLVLALAVGLSLGLLGGGGSILTVPIFVYVMGFDAKQSIAMSLIVVGLVSGIGAVTHWRAGRLDLRLAGLFGIVAMMASYAGARLALFLGGDAQLLLLAVVICVAAASMFWNAVRRPPPTAPPSTRAPVAVEGAAASGPGDDQPATTLSLARLAPVGIGVGFLTGVLGVGGGFLIVPALVVLGRVPMRMAIGTSLLVISMMCAAGEVGYLGHVSIPWAIVALFSAVAAVGIVIGTRLGGMVSTASLKRGFAVMLLGIGILMVAKNRGVLAAGHRATTGAVAPLPAK